MIIFVGGTIGAGKSTIARGLRQHKFKGKLAALRFPEWEVHHDDGTIIPIG